MDSTWVLTLANKNERLVHLEAVCFGGRGGGKLVLSLPSPTLGFLCTECLHQQTAVLGAMRPAWRIVASGSRL